MPWSCFEQLRRSLLAMKLIGGLVLVLAVPVLGGDIVLKGVARSQQASYLAKEAKKLFECRYTPKKTIPLSRVNDDFCDCEDGSDEPGTSACAGGRFYCRNRGHVGAYIPSSRVDDGICDCCDGSDEPQGTCPNNCEALSAESRAARAAKLKALELGAAKKKTYIEAGAKAREEMLKELDTLKAEIEGKKAKLETAKAAKDKAEEEEKSKQEALIAERAATLRAALGVNQGDLPAMKVLYDKVKNKRGKVIGRVLDELKTMLGPLLDEKPKDAPPAPASEEEKGEASDSEPVSDEGSEGPHEDDEYVASDGVASGGEEEQLPPEIVQALEAAEDGADVKTDEAEAARKDMREAETDVKDLEKKIKDLEDTTTLDVGTDMELWPLKGKCYSKSINQYVYEICPYETAKQKEGSSSVSLGRWDGFEDLEGGGFKFHFTKGQRCWNGPDRSMMVTVKCGVDEEVLSVDEPAMCEYTMEFVTPAACDARLAAQLKLDLEEADADGEIEPSHDKSPRTEL